ncbi:hypothetical protein Trydic_g19504, partial [Trypoxylus dichotomus]
NLIVSSLKLKFFDLKNYPKTRTEYSTFHKPFSHEFVIFTRVIFLKRWTVDLKQGTVSPRRATTILTNKLARRPRVHSMEDRTRKCGRETNLAG